MLLKKGQLPILITNILILVLFISIFLSRRNYEFLIYIGIIILFLILIILTNAKVNYSNTTLWGLTSWALLHMAGGGIFINGTRLYEIILIPLSEVYQIFKYDQFVHIIGFCVATLVMYELLKPLLKKNINKFTALSIVIVMAGLGVGALNEIVEFTATVIIPETGVGGYINTSLDLVADLIGSLIALAIIFYKEKWKSKT